MGLAAPLALLGLLAVALPVIAHLLRRRDVPVRPLPTIALLRKADVTSRRRVRVVDRALLLSRIALVALAALAIAAPYVSASLAWGDGRVASVAIVLDDSMSMDRRDGGGTVLDRAIERSRDVIGSLPQGSEVAIVLAGGPPRVVAPRSDDLAVARGALDDVVGGSARGTALEAAIELAGRQLAGARHPLRRVIVLSDLAGTAEAGEPDLPRDVAIEIERVGPDETAPNVALTEAIATPDPTSPGYVSIAIAARAFGGARERATVVVRRGGDELARGEIALASGGAASGGRTALRIPAGEHGDPTAEVALELEPPDALPTDDRRGVLVRPASAPRVLLVDGDPQPLGRRRLQGGGEEVRFVAQALSLAPTAEGGFVRRTVDPHSFLTTPLDDVDVVVLANVASDDPSLRVRVEQHLARGGGVLVTAGDHVEPGAWARMEAVLPARVVSVVDGESVGLVRVEGELLPGGPTGLEAVRTTRRLALEPGAGAITALAWSDGSPALVLGGARRIAILGTTVDDAWTDLPYRPGFLPLIVRLLRAVAPPGAMPDAPFAPGEAPELRAPSGATALQLISPTGRVVAIEGSALTRPIDLAGAHEPGAWRVRVAGADGELAEAPRSAFVVAPPIAESDLSIEALADVAREAPPAEQQGRSEIRRSMAPLAFLLVGLAAIMEALLRMLRPRHGSVGERASDRVIAAR